MPSSVMTVTSATVPASCGGETALIDVEDPRLNEAAGAPANSTWTAPARFVPLMVTVVPPVDGPDETLRPLTVGVVVEVVVAVNWSALLVADVPPAVVTVMCV